MNQLKIEGVTRTRLAQLARGVAKALRGGDTISLEGELGSGKTAFVQELAKAMGVKDRVTSPTFVVVKPYKIAVPSLSYLYHVDCYRLQNPQELTKLGLAEILEDPRAVTVIEWGERVRALRRRYSLRIQFMFMRSRLRALTFIDHASGRFLNALTTR